MDFKTKQDFLKKTFIVWLGALICCALWGSAFPFVKIGYKLFNISSDQTASQLLFAGLRFTLAGILVIIIGSIISRKLLIPEKHTVSKIIKLSSFQTVAQYLFYYIGLAHTTGVKASIIIGINVFISILVSSLLFHLEKINSKKIIGCIVGFIGVVLVNLSGNKLDFSFSFFGEGFIFLSTIAYAFSSVFMKRYSKNENPIVLSGYQFLFGGIILTLLGLIFGGKITTVTTSGIIILIYLSLVSAVAYSLWGILLKYNPVSKVAVFGFMNPVFGVLLSSLLLNESQSLGITSIIALFLVSIGIYVVNKEKQS